MNALELIQSNLGLDPDGKIGPNTFKAMKTKWSLTGIQLAHFLGQCEHETGSFNVFEENLNYSSERLLQIFPKYYPDKLLAIKHDRKPVLIANHVYRNRMGNNQPNDGWHFKGRGAIQLTGRDNYRSFSESVKDVSILEYPGLLGNKYAFDSALWYFNQRNIFRICTDLSIETIKKVTRLVNGGLHGIEDRVRKTLKYQAFIDL